ncbi:putative transcription activator [Cryptosporidium canis]|uniref:Transcription activator n=1 Tax=Cryptosporidium canis TaxID=195482 RepID=A0ABQ8P702_9CRYT|nr:putative transcription activator [Cryptosporidium canis]KAJ1614412.1 putative transcription activator [Cryptosporidium canis]
MNNMENKAAYIDNSGVNVNKGVNEPVMYICGECGVDVSLLTHGAAVRCRTCGCRILYKKRTRKMIQYEAR